MIGVVGVVAALAGPLDAPDPTDMGKLRCEPHPLGLDNAYGLGERTVGTTPPGPPTFPTGLQARLAPFATDSALRKASKGAGAYPAPAVASLASVGSVVRRDCENRATTMDHFFVGCRVAVQCEVLVTHDGATLTFDRRPQVGAKLAPVETPAEALGLTWFLDPELFLPLTPEELAAWAEESANYTLVEPAVPWVEIEEQPKGWLVRAPRRVGCGCDHDIVRRAYWIARDGRSCAVVEPPVPLAVAKADICVD